MKRYVKDSNAVVDYTVDWSKFLGVDVINGSVWVPDHNLWQAATSYPAGTIVRLSTNEILEVTVAGISGSSQPSPPDIGETVVDGTVIWLRSFSVKSDLASQNSTTVWVEGGTVNKEYAITNRINTAADRQADETLAFIIIEK